MELPILSGARRHLHQARQQLHTKECGVYIQKQDLASLQELVSCVYLLTLPIIPCLMVSEFECKKILDSDALAFSASEVMRPYKSHAIDLEVEECPNYRALAQHPDSL